MYQVKTAIAIIVYNRPEKVKNLLDQVQQNLPSKIYVIADGPKLNNTSDQLKTSQVRALFDNINWNCEVIRIFSDTNLGLCKRVVSGLNEVFKSEEQVIILEDDLEPDQSFFRYADTLLDLYKNNSSIMSICGTNLFNNHSINSDNSYFYSRYTNSWGWATWSDRWSHYSDNLDNYNILKKNGFFRYVMKGYRSQVYWEKIFQNIKNKKLDSWAYRWMMSSWLNNGLNIVPKYNLIANRGIDDDATHTKSRRFYFKVGKHQMTFPLIHPDFVVSDFIYDSKCEDYIYSKSILGRIKWLIEKLF